MKRYSPTKNYITPLNKILENDKLAVTTICNDLTTRGYSFIRLTPQMVEQIDNCVKIIDGFFNKNINYKKGFEKEPIFGYYDVRHKESFRFLTGSRLDEQKLPDDFKPIKNLINKVDQIMHTMTLLCTPYIFKNIMSKAEELDIPMFNAKRSSWGMFDMVKYLNTGTRKELNCKEHIDPGLLSFSLRSTEPGLQLMDEYGKWIKPPHDSNIAILWTGDAATKINPKIKPGYHRVVNPEPLNFSNSNKPKPRISMWHEICCASQERLDLLKKDGILKSKNYQSTTGLPSYKSIENLKSNGSTETESKSKPDWGKIYKYNPNKGINLVQAKIDEDVSGIPVSKSLPPKTKQQFQQEEKNKHYTDQGSYLLDMFDTTSKYVVNPYRFKPYERYTDDKQIHNKLQDIYAIKTGKDKDMFMQDLRGRGPGWFVMRDRSGNESKVMDSVGTIYT